MSPVISLQTEIILTHSRFHHLFFNPQGLLGEAGPPGPKGGKGIEVTKQITNKNTKTHSHLDFGNLFLIVVAASSLCHLKVELRASAVPGSQTRNVKKQKEITVKVEGLFMTKHTEKIGLNFRRLYLHTSGPKCQKFPKTPC